MKSFLYSLTTILLFLLMPLGTVQAQLDSTSFEITYGETRRRLFAGAVDSTFSERWRLLESRTGDVPIIRVTRISGQVTPQLRLYDNSGTLLAESVGDAYSDSEELIYTQGLPADSAPYQIEVIGTDVISRIDNPVEYSLTVIRDGTRRINPDEGLSPLPELGTQPAPDLPVITEQTLAGAPVITYGTNLDLDSTSEGTLIRSARYELILTNSATQGIRDVSITGEGIGLRIQNSTLLDNPERRFFSDEDVSVNYNDSTRTFTFSTAGGQVIRTNFAQIESIEVRGEVVAVRISDGEQAQRMVFDGQAIEVRYSGGDSPAYTIQADERQLVTDGALWDTLAIYQDEVRLYGVTGGRLLSTRQTITINGERADGIQLISIPAEGQTVSLRVDWARLDTIRLNTEQLEIEARNGTLSAEPIAELTGVWIEDGAVRYTRRDGTYRTVYPDGTDIRTPTQLAENADILPYETGYRTRNFNNLGVDIVPHCPCYAGFDAESPINPTNGNFFYNVTDFKSYSQGLALRLQRYYNSHDSRYEQGIVADSRLNPRYLINAPVHYPRFGNGWRHSYQYELDIASAPLGRITFIEPDGTGHYFFPLADGAVWQSRTYLALTIIREGGLLGRWRAEHSDGTRYEFDRVGRLTRIDQGAQSITITPAPLTYNSSTGMQGTFIVGTYGRRIELYSGESGRIEIGRDSELSQIDYRYEDGNLIGVSYEPAVPEASAEYRYTAFGLLARYNDVRSPYTQSGTIDYDPQNRAQNYLENPDGDLTRRYVFLYQDEADQRITNRIFEVGGERRIQTWTYNDRWQLTRFDLPAPNWNYQFSYDATTGQLQSVRVPTGVNFNLTFDGRGNLLRFEDPAFTGDSAYNLSYEQRGTRSLLTQIRYPNNHTDSFIWSDDPDPRLLAQETVISIGAQAVTRTTRYEYDAQGRVVMRVDPGNIATVFGYDTLGHVASIRSGIALEMGETRADVSDSARATRSLSLEHNLSGRLQQVIDGQGVVYTLNWTPRSGRVQSISAGDEVRISYRYDARGRITAVDDRGQETLYTYNGLDLVRDVVDATGAIQSFRYDEAGNVLSIVNELGLTTNYQYDALDQISSQRTPNGLLTTYRTAINSEANALIRTQIDPSGRVLTSRYNFLGRLTRYTISATDSDIPFQEFRLSYSSQGNLTNIEDTQIGGRTIDLSYNLIGEVLGVTVSGSETRFRYDERGNLANVASPAGRVIDYDYDTQNNLAEVTLPDRTQWAYGYDSNGNLRTATDPLGETTAYTPDALNQLATVTDALGQMTSYSYDQRGNLTSITDPSAINTRFSYDLLDRLISTTDGSGNTINYEYDALGRLEVIGQTDASPPTRLTYDSNDNIIAITQQRERTLYSYDVLGRLTSMTDALGHTTSYDYNPVGLVTRVRDALGNTEQFSWRVGTNFLQAYTDAAGQTYAINTDELGRVSAIRLLAETVRNAPDNLEPINTQIFYDADGYIDRIQLGTLNARSSGTNDRLYQFQYDENGNPTAYVDPLGGEWQVRYDDNGQVIEVINPRGISTQYQYDAIGQMVSVTHYAGEDIAYDERFSYSPNGNVTAQVIAERIRNEYEYYPNNLLSRARLAVDSTTPAEYLFDYNAFGRLTFMLEPGGREHTYLYPLNAPNNLATYQRGTEQADYTTSYQYDAVGNLISVTFPGSQEDINLSYDALDRRVRFVDSTDNSWAYTYDASNNIAQISDPLGSVVAYQYDPYDRVTAIAYPSGNTVNFSYESAGNLNLTAITLPPNANGERQRIGYQLDELGRLRAIQTSNTPLSFDYDTMGNVIQRRAPDGTVTAYDYDPAGRLTGIRYNDDTPDVIYSYDTLGNLDAVGAIELAHDVFGRMTQLTDVDTLGYEYDSAGNRITRISNTLGTTGYTYNGNYAVEQITFGDQQVSLSYDASGRVDRMIRGNLTSTISYDENNRITRVAHFTVNGAQTTRLDLFIYNYDTVGNLVKVERVDASGLTSEVSYGYDIDQRLVSERWLSNEGETFYVVTYRYDAVGNRIEETRNGRITRYTYNERNQLIREQRDTPNDSIELFMFPPALLALMGLILVRRRRWRALVIVPISLGLLVGVAFAQSRPPVIVDYSYDANGNVTRIQYNRDETYTLNLSYDNENRLIAVQGQYINFNDESAEFGVDVDTRYRYDALNRLTTIESLAGTYTLYYDGHTLIGMSDGTTTERYLTLNGERLLTVTDDGDALWNLNDRQGSTRRFADAQGNLLEEPAYQREFGGFGVRVYPYNENRTAPGGTRIDRPTQFFAGQLYDPSTRLYLMGMRAYDPASGRFLQPDPVRQDPIGTLYTYARNRPLTFYDPTGLNVEPFTEPLDASTLDQQVDPERLIPRLDIAPIPAVSVNRLQADESVRALELLALTRHQLNDTVFQLAPFNDGLYLFALNPMPDGVQAVLANPLAQMLAHYDSATGWASDPRPDPQADNDLFAWLNDLNQVLIGVQAPTLSVQTRPTEALRLVPQVSLPDPLGNRALEHDLAQALQPIQPMVAFETESDTLINLVPPEIAPDVSLPRVDLPQVLIEPALLDDLDRLRAQTYQFYSRLWGANGDRHLPPLGFNQ
ncbi:MAG: RHS repeat-associated core domain-containing protein [Anaerolineae bacterium]